MEIKFSPDAWEQYTGWQHQDRRILKRINEVLKDIVRGKPFEGIGKPEPLRGKLSGFWSRHIDERNRLVYRLVYRIEGDVCQIAQCKGHYCDVTPPLPVRREDRFAGKRGFRLAPPPSAARAPLRGCDYCRLTRHYENTEKYM